MNNLNQVFEVICGGQYGHLSRVFFNSMAYLQPATTGVVPVMRTKFSYGAVLQGLSELEALDLVVEENDTLLRAGRVSAVLEGMIVVQV